MTDLLMVNLVPTPTPIQPEQDEIKVQEGFESFLNLLTQGDGQLVDFKLEATSENDSEDGSEFSPLNMLKTTMKETVENTEFSTTEDLMKVDPETSPNVGVPKETAQNIESILPTQQEEIDLEVMTAEILRPYLIEPNLQPKEVKLANDEQVEKEIEQVLPITTQKPKPLQTAKEETVQLSNPAKISVELNQLKETIKQVETTLEKPGSPVFRLQEDGADIEELDVPLKEALQKVERKSERTNTLPFSTLDKEVTTPEATPSTEEAVAPVTVEKTLTGETTFKAESTTSSIDKPAVLQQVFKPVEKAFKEDVDRIQIDLHPKSLGRVLVQMNIKDGVVVLNVSASEQDTLNLLSQEADTLSSLLKDAGLEADANQMQFNLSQQDSEFEENSQNTSRQSHTMAEKTAVNAPKIITKDPTKLLDISL